MALAVIADEGMGAGCDGAWIGADTGFGQAKRANGIAFEEGLDVFLLLRFRADRENRFAGKAKTGKNRCAGAQIGFRDLAG